MTTDPRLALAFSLGSKGALAVPYQARVPPSVWKPAERRLVVHDHQGLDDP